MAGYVQNGPMPHDWPESEDRFHRPYAEIDSVDSPFSIAINDRNHVRTETRVPPRTRALKGFFSDDD